MKKLFKNMSIVLVLALVIGLVPARNASAADFSLKVKNKYLYVGAKGEKAHGVDANGNLPANPIKRSYKVKVTGRADGDVLSFKSADRTIAKGSKKYERVFAVAPGETDVAVKINGAEIGSIHFIVKQNATAVALADLPEGNQFGIGTFEVKTAMTPAEATDVVKLHIDDAYKDIAVVNEDGTITTKKPGDFEMYATTQQNEAGLNGVICTSEKIKCTAAVKVVSAAQKSANEVNFVFDNDMKKIASAKDFKVTYVANGATIDFAVKGVAVDKEEPTKVTLSTWSEFTANTEYTVAYGTENFTFTAADLSLANAAEVKFITKAVVYNELTPIDFVVVDAKGVELNADAKNSVSFTTANTTDCSIAAQSILFFSAGKSANVTATFEGWYTDADGKYTSKSFKNTAVITSKEADPITAVEQDFTISSATFTLADFEDPDYAQQDWVALNDYTRSLGTKVTFYIEYSDESVVSNASGYTNKAGISLIYKVADSNIAVIDSTGVIKPVATGSTQVLVYANATAKTPLYVIPVTVKPAAVPTTLTVTPSKNYLNSTTAAFTDQIDTKVYVADQYQRGFNGASLVLAQAAKSDTADYDAIKNVSLSTADNSIGYPGYQNVVVSATSGNIAGNAGSMTFTVYAKDAAGNKTNTASFSITAKSVVGDADSYALILDTTEVDTTVDGETVFATSAKVNVMKQATKDGYAIASASAAYLDTYVAGTSTTGATGTAYVYELYKGATLIKNAGRATDVATNGSINFFYRPAAGDGNEFVKMAAGNYSVQLYKVEVTYDENTAIYTTKKTFITSKNVTVVDDQASVSFKKEADKIAANALVENPTTKICPLSGTTAVFTTYYDGEEIINKANATYAVVKGDKSAFVKELSYKVAASGLDYFTVSCPVGLTLIYE